jgi:hypothetical protein
MTSSVVSCNLYNINERNNSMIEKKPPVFKSPDLKDMQEVVIDYRTKIYIGMDEDPKKAKIRYLEKFASMRKF